MEHELKLPLSVIGYADLRRISRSLESYDSRSLGTKAGNQARQPLSDAALEELAQLNGVSLNDSRQCRSLKSAIDGIADKLPQINISFAVEPSAKVNQVILAWLRKNIHPLLLMNIGLQPGIAAGCVIRTPNKIFDLSLRAYVQNQDEYLSQLIKGAVSAN